MATIWAGSQHRTIHTDGLSTLKLRTWLNNSAAVSSSSVSSRPKRLSLASMPRIDLRFESHSHSLSLYLSIYLLFFNNVISFLKWVITDTACHTYSFVNVPLYDTLGLEAISFILLQSKYLLIIISYLFYLLFLCIHIYLIIIHKINFIQLN